MNAVNKISKGGQNVKLIYFGSIVFMVAGLANAKVEMSDGSFYNPIAETLMTIAASVFIVAML